MSNIADGHWMRRPNFAVAPRRKSTKRLTLADLQHAAANLGGECLSTEYVSLRTPMRWRCAAGHEWEVQAQNVRRGQWCMRCSGNMRKTLEEMKVLAHSRGGVCLSRTFKNMSTKLRWRCGCGHRWKARPHLIGQGQWCPRCANESRRKKMRDYAAQARSSGVDVREHLGYHFAGGTSLQPANDTAAPLDADALCALIIERAAELASRIAKCAEGSDEERELEAIADAIEA